MYEIRRIIKDKLSNPEIIVISDCLFKKATTVAINSLSGLEKKLTSKGALKKMERNNIMFKTLALL